MVLLYSRHSLDNFHFNLNRQCENEVKLIRKTNLTVELLMIAIDEESVMILVMPNEDVTILTQIYKYQFIVEDQSNRFVYHVIPVIGHFTTSYACTFDDI